MNNDIIGGLTAQGYTGNDYSTAAAIRIKADGNFSASNSGGYIVFQTREQNDNKPLQDRMTIRHDGRVGIGTDNPKAKLDVHGDALIRGDLYAEEVIVEDAADWPDYVFDDDYELMSLGELKNFITENRHLPGMPKADENGNVKNLKLIQLNTQLLKKIEELTLYLLEQEERIKSLEGILR